MTQLDHRAPNPPVRPPFGVRLLGVVLLTFSIGLLSCQALWSI